MEKENIEQLRIINTRLAEALAEAIGAIEKAAGDNVLLWNKKVRGGRTVNTLVKHLHVVMREAKRTK